MQLSDEGIRLIKSFEGYHKALPDGGCAAYLCPANVPTIGWGCTEGVKLGMVWTKEEAETALKREIAKFEEGVSRLVTAEINQNQFDALVSFAYNVGLGAFEKSSVLKAVNKRQFSKVPAALALWNKGGGKVLPGLVSRRTREAALFLKPVTAPEEGAMPQDVMPARPITKTEVAIGTGAAAGGGAVALPTIPVPPDLSAYAAWQSFGEAVSSLGTWAWANPVLTLGIAAWIGATIYWPRIKTHMPWRVA